MFVLLIALSNKLLFSGDVLSLKKKKYNYHRRYTVCLKTKQEILNQMSINYELYHT